MPTGDQTDALARAKGVLPGGWFPGTGAAVPSVTPVLDAALAGPAWGWSWLYGLLEYVAAQHRIETATDSNLDLIGGDYFGTGLLRRMGETDAGYRQRILASLLAPRGTRAAVIAVLTQLTGKAPAIFEPGRPADTGAWGNIASGTLNTGLGYGVAGGWGDLLLPAQFFVTVQRPVGGGIAYAAGWGSGFGGWGVGAIEYASLSMIANEVTDSDIYAAVNLSRPAGTTAWVAITGSNAPQLGENFALGYSTLS
jgi:hypothetical protein